jgi:hypothetical protein
VPRIARFFALAGLLSVSACLVCSQSLPPREKKLVIFLTSDATLAPAISAEMQREVDHLMQASAIRVEWRSPADQGGVRNNYAAVVRLRGSCRPSAPSARFQHAVSGPFPLASSEMADGVILPFGDIDCGALNAFLGPSLWKEPEQKRDFMYGRAMARLLAHELYHVIEQTSTHARAGVAKPAFTVAELLSEHFEFTDEVIAEVHAASGAYPMDAGEVSGK